MTELLSKISSYNIFNFLFPGALFTFGLDKLGIIHLGKLDVVTLALLYYTFGLLISRFGSIVLEPILKWMKVISYSDYSDYISACRIDPKIELLVEQNNTYRTVFSAVIILLLSFPVRLAADKMSLSQDLRHGLLAAAIATLLAISFRKQSAFINKRVRHACPSPILRT